MPVRIKSSLGHFDSVTFRAASVHEKPRLFLLLLLLSLADNANAASAQMSSVQVQVYEYAGLSPAALHEFVARIYEILASAGVVRKP